MIDCRATGRYEWLAKVDVSNIAVAVVGRDSAATEPLIYDEGARSVSVMRASDDPPKSNPDVIIFTEDPPVDVVALSLAMRARKTVYVRAKADVPDWWHGWLDQLQKMYPNSLLFDRVQDNEGIRITAGLGRKVLPNPEKWQFSEIIGAGRTLSLDPIRVPPLGAEDQGFPARIREWLAAEGYGKIDELERRVSACADRLAEPLSDFDYSNGINGALYWLAFLKGYFEWREADRVVVTNTYLHYFMGTLMQLDIDPGHIDKAQDVAAISAIVERRFVDLERLRNGETVLPVVLFNALPDDGTLRRRFARGDCDSSVMGTHFDGYHRLAGALMTRCHNLPCLTAWDLGTSQFANRISGNATIRRQMLEWIATSW